MFGYFSFYYFLSFSLPKRKRQLQIIKRSFVARDNCVRMLGCVRIRKRIKKNDYSMSSRNIQGKLKRKSKKKVFQQSCTLFWGNIFEISSGNCSMIYSYKFSSYVEYVCVVSQIAKCCLAAFFFFFDLLELHNFEATKQNGPLNFSLAFICVLFLPFSSLLFSF